ncbi:MAG TPA: hypothetical protein VGD78_19045 [Chthoniobacterales bacterium]
MPNGHDKNWVRLCVTINGFRMRYGRWPSRVRMPEGCIADLRDRLFTGPEFEKITAKITLIPDEQSIVAEDDSGASFAYGEQRPGAGACLGVDTGPNPSL